MQTAQWPELFDFDVFSDIWRRQGGIRGAARAHADLRDRYAESHRHHHTARHVAECLAALRDVRPLLQRADEAALALYFHDAVYEPARHDNERRSADLFRRHAVAAGFEASSIARVQALILATATHDTGAGDATMVCDVDLAVLGSTPERFAEFERDVRLEYARFPEAIYRAGRARVLRGFLTRKKIYGSLHFSHLEARARLNLEAALSTLREGRSHA